MPPFAVVPAAPLLPEGLARLADDAAVEGIRVVATLLARWEDGTEQFEGPGEALLAATSAAGVIGVGGLSTCPDVAGALRVRRFYVAPAWRRRGVARALATRLVERGLGHVDTITCNARASPAATPFWERLGFVPADAEGVTHVLRR